MVWGSSFFVRICFPFHFPSLAAVKGYIGFQITFDLDPVLVASSTPGFRLDSACVTIGLDTNSRDKINHTLSWLSHSPACSTVTPGKEGKRGEEISRENFT